MADPASTPADAVRSADPDRHLSVLYAPESKREDLIALYAFNIEISSIRDRITAPMPGEMRLQWWRDIIGAEASDGATSPLARSLLDAIARNRLPGYAFENYIDARTFDLYDDPMPSRVDLEGYCGETASALIQLASMILDPGAAAAHAALSGHAGCALSITGILRLLPLHVARGQCFVPRDLLAAAGGTPEMLLAADAGDPFLARVVQAMTALARHHLDRFHESASEIPVSLRPAFLPVAPVGRYLSALDEAGADAVRRPVTISPVRRHYEIFRRAVGGWRRSAF